MKMRYPGSQLLAAAMSIGCACFATATPAADWIERSLKPADLHEECMKLKPGSRLDYAFATPGKLDFNIHYHAGSAVHYPVLNKEAQKLEGSFSPAIEQGYCMMWSNPGAEPTQFRYRFSVHDDDTPAGKK
jgi:hypothetical protein